MPANADAVARRLVRMLPHLINAIDDRDFRVFIGEALGRHLADIELAPLLGRAIAVLMANGFHETLLDRLLDFCREFLEEREEQLYMAAEAQRRRWWIPKAINRQIARAIIGGVKELLSKLREPGTPARRNLLREIERLAEQLRTSPVYRARVEEAKLRLLEDAEVKAWLGSVWGDIKRLLLADFASPQSRMDHALGAVIRSLGHHLGAIPQCESGSIARSKQWHWKSCPGVQDWHNSSSRLYGSGTPAASPTESNSLSVVTSSTFG